MEKILSLLPLMLLVILTLSTTLSQAVRCHRCDNRQNPECGIPFKIFSGILSCNYDVCYLWTFEREGPLTPRLEKPRFLEKVFRFLGFLGF